MSGETYGEVLKDFIETCCEVKKDNWVQPRYLYDGYSAWCEELGLVPLSMDVFDVELSRQYQSLSIGFVGPNIQVITGISLVYSGRVSE